MAGCGSRQNGQHEEEEQAVFIVLLRFSSNKARAAEFMDGHKAWIQKGFADGVFAVVGSLRPEGGGAVLAHGIDREELKARVNEDPFVAEKVVEVEIHEIAPSRMDERLDFLAA